MILFGWRPVRSTTEVLFKVFLTVLTRPLDHLSPNTTKLAATASYHRLRTYQSTVAVIAAEIMVILIKFIIVVVVSSRDSSISRSRNRFSSSCGSISVSLLVGLVVDVIQYLIVGVESSY